jgi:thiol-disulfide isomerase/thioredoxin
MRGPARRRAGPVRPAVGAALGAVAAFLTLTACTDVPVPDAKIDVGSPALVKAKAAAGIDDCEAVTGDRVEGGLPSVTLPCLGGGPEVDVASLRGPMLVSLWAAWCSPCREEMPVLQSFYADHGKQVPLLGVDFQDAQPDRAIALADELGATFPSLADPYGDLSGRDPLPVLNGLPHLLFIDADGTIAYHHIGEVTSEREIVDLVGQHLGVTL